MPPARVARGVAGVVLLLAAAVATSVGVVLGPGARLPAGLLAPAPPPAVEAPSLEGGAEAALPAVVAAPRPASADEPAVVVISRTLRFDWGGRPSAGEEARRVQRRLLALAGEDPVRATGVYDVLTQRGVAAFQAGRGLPPTGAVDRRTWEALFDDGAATPSRP